MSRKSRRILRQAQNDITASFKTKVVLEALSERYSVQELARKHELHPNQISTWKAQFVENAEAVFERPKSEKNEEETEKDRLLKTIGQQKVELDFLRKVSS